MADRGAPIVAKIAGKWAVVSGNGRKIAFDRLARGTHANWDNYRRYWAAHATEVGIDPQAVAANPGGFLARVLLPGQGIDLPQFAAEANEDDKARMSGLIRSCSAVLFSGVSSRCLTHNELRMW